MKVPVNVKNREFINRVWLIELKIKGEM
jgi:hypothetical protein